MPTKVYIPGVGEVSFPDDMSDDQILRQAQLLYEERAAESPRIDPGMSRDEMIAASGEGFEALRGVDKASIPRMAGRRFADNMLNTPEATGNLLAGGAAFGQTVAGTVPQFFDGEDMTVSEGFQSFQDRFRTNMEREQQQFPASALRAIDLPDTFDIQAGAKTAADAVTGNADQGLSESFDANRDEALEREIAKREAAPNAALMGDAFGDAATLAAVRRPRSVIMRDARIAARRASAEAPPSPSTMQPLMQVESFPAAVRNQLNEAVDSTLARNLRRGGLRISEAGFEGAMLAAMNDADPLTGAALSAGAQTIGSGLLASSEKLVGRGGINAAIAAAGLTAYLQMIKEATPGGRDRILESSESAFAKLSALIVLGGMAGAAGAGRVSGRTADRFPTFADAVTALPRGSVQSFLREFAERDDQEFIESIFRKMGQDPNYFGTTARRRIERAVYNPDISPIKVIDNLRADPQFRRAISRLSEEQ